ncbi:MAG: hypothetical protein IT452_08895 [Planctomycetia bacterium]|nr:hypothetical protein [Planctomycetia bacterium]
MTRVTAALLAAALALPAAAAPPPADGAPARILWSQGHNELKLESDGPDGAGDFRKVLETAFPRTAVEPVWLSTMTEDPPGDAVLMIAGPKRDLSEAEAAKLALLLARGARVLVCVDPSIEHERVELDRLRRVLRDAGAEVGTARIVDRDGALALPADPMPSGRPKVQDERAVFAARFDRADHPLLALLPAGTGIVFSDACRVAAMSSGTDPFDAREIASTSATAFSAEGGKQRGPAGPVAVAAAQRAGRGRFVVAGDATFLTNGFAARTRQTGAPVAIAAIRWLSEGLAGPRPAAAARAAAANVAPGDREPLVLIAAGVAACLLVAASLAFGRRE